MSIRHVKYILVFQLKELEEEWSKVERGTPERYTRSQQAKMEEEEEEEDEADGGTCVFGCLLE